MRSSHSERSGDISSVVFCKCQSMEIICVDGILYHDDIGIHRRTLKYPWSTVDKDERIFV